MVMGGLYTGLHFAGMRSIFKTSSLEKDAQEE
jgi:hypothetical protein